jgi:hypothetical protein
MKTNETATIHYSFDDLEIIGVFGENVYVKGLIDFEHECIIKISRPLFLKSLEIWLNDKKSYCESWKDFCGCLGSIQSTDVEEIHEKLLKPFKLKAYQFNSIEEFTDMEHG